MDQSWILQVSHAVFIGNTVAPELMLKDCIPGGQGPWPRVGDLHLGHRLAQLLAPPEWRVSQLCLQDQKVGSLGP